jgi:hypothetical protein
MSTEESGSGGWILLSDTYGLEGNIKAPKEVRGEMRRQGVQKAASGCSWVEMGQRTVEAGR